MGLELKKKPAKGSTDEAVKVSKKVQTAMDKPFVAHLPVVNLLPPEVKDEVEQQRLKRLFLVLAAVVVGALVAVFLGQQAIIAVAQGKLDVVQGEGEQLSAREGQLAPVKMFYDQIDANKYTIQNTMAREVLTSQVVREINRLSPAGLKLTNIGLTLDGTTGAATEAAATGACPSQDPYNAAGMSAGCVTVDGTAASRSVLGEWLDLLGDARTFTSTFIPATTADPEGGGVAFSATIGLSDSVYKNRYADPEFLKNGSK
jgi:Tfp pilus assembly protein PilN